MIMQVYTLRSGVFTYARNDCSAAFLQQVRLAVLWQGVADWGFGYWIKRRLDDPIGSNSLEVLWLKMLFGGIKRC